MSELKSLFASTQETIQQCRDLLAQMDSDQQDGAYVVSVQGVWLAFSFVDGVAVDPKPCGVSRASVFSLVEAQRLAVTVQNGNRVSGKAVPLTAAIASTIAAHQEVLQLLRGHCDKVRG